MVKERKIKIEDIFTKKDKEFNIIEKFSKKWGICE